MPKLTIEFDQTVVTLELLESEAIRFGRGPDSSVRIDGVQFPTVSWNHAELKLRGEMAYLVHLSNSNPTLLNGRGVEVDSPIKAGDSIRLGTTGPEIKIISVEMPESPSLATQSASKSDLVKAALTRRSIELKEGLLLGRRPDSPEGLLDHPQVSKQHASIGKQNGDYFISDLGSTNGTFVNGKRISEPQVLQPQDVIDIGPFSLVLEGNQLRCRTRANNLELECNGVGRVVKASGGRMLTLLQDISFTVPPGKFLCLLGPSGSGKSTLLGVLSGRSSATNGLVKLNGRHLHENFNAVKEDMVVVPQTTELYFPLRVEDSLRFTAALRLPSDTGPEELRQSVGRVMETVGIEARRMVPIKNLSGGQLKRVGLATELTSDPSLLFLDEVTSGLDERSDQEMMNLFRSLADAGKTIVCVTHNLANVEKFSHLVAVLTVGGRLAFIGSPEEAKDYFGAGQLADIYEVLETRQPEEWAAKFIQTSQYRVHGIADATNQVSTMDDQETSLRGLGRKVIRQTAIVALRNAFLWKNDLLALASLLGQAGLVAILICIVFGDVGTLGESPADEGERLGKIRNLLFLLTVSVFWLGCNNSAKELVKERSIFTRERDFNLLPESYLMSKLGVMILIGLFQVAILGAMVFIFTGFPSALTPQFLNLFLLSVAGTSLGLAISALAKSEETAIALVPVVVIPQIILSGVVAKLPGFAEWLAKGFITVYWGHHAAMDLPDKHRIPTDFEPTIGFCWFIIGLHTLVFLTVCWAVTRWQKRI